MIKRAVGDGWEATEATEYKNEPGVWQDVTRRVLFDSEESGFQARYFEVAAGGHTTRERHWHEHFVMVIRGRGKVLLDQTWTEIGPLDTVHVAPMQAHQFTNLGNEPFGILCIVDRNRDRPIPVDCGEDAEASI